MAKTLELSVDFEDGIDAFGEQVNDLIGEIMQVALGKDWVLGVACGMDYRTADIEKRYGATIDCIIRTAKYHASRGESIHSERLLHHVQKHLDPQENVQ